MTALGQSAEGWHVFAEASFLSYADRDKYVADPDFVEVETGLMLNRDYLKSRANLISMDAVIEDVKAGNPSAFLRGKDATPDNPGTSHFTVVDKDGLVVSMTTTVEAPLKRPRSSMAPSIVFNPDGEFLFSTGSPGGNSIIAYTAKSIVGILDWGLSRRRIWHDP